MALAIPAARLAVEPRLAQAAHAIRAENGALAVASSFDLTVEVRRGRFGLGLGVGGKS